MPRRRKFLLTLAVAVAAVAGTSATALTQSGSARCDASFNVLHDDQIGNLELPEGAYRLSRAGMSCLRASHLFSDFLADYDGVLPKPWRYRANAAGDGTFRRGSGDMRFRAIRTGDVGPGSTGHPTEGGGSHGDLMCRGVFEVLHNNRIGDLRLPRGDYTVTRLGVRLSCAAAYRLFGRFLHHPGGRLPDGWTVLPAHAEFVKYSTTYGFRIEKPAG